MKKPTSKVVHNRPKFVFSVLSTGQKPKSQFLFHKNFILRDLCVMTLLTIMWDGKNKKDTPQMTNDRYFFQIGWKDKQLLIWLWLWSFFDGFKIKWLFQTSQWITQTISKRKFEMKVSIMSTWAPEAIRTWGLKSIHF